MIMRLWLLVSFCASFIGYQLNTLRMLTKQPTPTTNSAADKSIKITCNNNNCPTLTSNRQPQAISSSNNNRLQQQTCTGTSLNASSLEQRSGSRGRNKELQPPPTQLYATHRQNNQLHRLCHQNSVSGLRTPERLAQLRERQARARASFLRAGSVDTRVNQFQQQRHSFQVPSHEFGRPSAAAHPRVNQHPPSDGFGLHWRRAAMAVGSHQQQQPTQMHRPLFRHPTIDGERCLERAFQSLTLEGQHPLSRPVAQQQPALMLPATNQHQYHPPQYPAANPLPPTHCNNHYQQQQLMHPNSSQMIGGDYYRRITSAPHPSNAPYVSCHRARNATYSFQTRQPPMASGQSNYVDDRRALLQQQPQLRQQPVDFMGPANYTRQTHQRQQQPPISGPMSGALLTVDCGRPHYCSPSSSGSLPGSLHLSNRLSQSDSMDCSLEEPVSLPLPAKDLDFTAGQLSSNRQRPPDANVAPSKSNRSSQAHSGREAIRNYHWQTPSSNWNNLYGRDPSQRQVIHGHQQAAADSQHAACRRPAGAGSDGELYARLQRREQDRSRRNDNLTTGKHPLSSAHYSQSLASDNRIIDPQHLATSGAQLQRSSRSSRSSSPQASNAAIRRVQKSPDSRPPSSASRKACPSGLSLAGARRRLGFKQKGLSSLSVHRSEEVIPMDARLRFIRQMTASAESTRTVESIGTYWQHYHHKSPQQEASDPRNDFVEGLGAGQIASRQALVSPYLGDIQLTLSDRRGMLEVEVVRARRLQLKTGAKSLPSPFVKIYLMRNKKCLAKQKTQPARRTLDPLYQKQFIFREDYSNCVLQVIVWGDYGKQDRKSLMGIVQIRLNDLDISNLVIDWYRLFNEPSMTNSTYSSKALRHMILAKSLDTSIDLQSGNL